MILGDLIDEEDGFMTNLKNLLNLAESWFRQFIWPRVVLHYHEAVIEAVISYPLAAGPRAGRL
jgi:hypothetical protein